MAGPDYGGITKGIQGQFDYERQKAAQSESTTLQGQKDALARKAAQLGGGPSGAFIKAEQQAGNDSAQRLQNANEGINQQQAAAIRDVNMTQLGQQYQTSERLGSQSFATGERLGSQTWQGGENQANRDTTKYGIDTNAATSKYATDTGANTAKYGIDTNAATAKAGQDIQEKGLNHTIDQDKLEFDQNTKTLALNAIQTLVGANYNGADIKKLVDGLVPGFMDQLGDINRVTVNGPGQGDGGAAPAAPKPVASTYRPPSTPTYAGNTQDPYYNPGGN